MFRSHFRRIFIQGHPNGAWFWWLAYFTTAYQRLTTKRGNWKVPSSGNYYHPNIWLVENGVVDTLPLLFARHRSVALLFIRRKYRCAGWASLVRPGPVGRGEYYRNNHRHPMWMYVMITDIPLLPKKIVYFETVNAIDIRKSDNKWCARMATKNGHRALKSKIFLVYQMLVTHSTEYMFYIRVHCSVQFCVSHS